MLSVSLQLGLLKESCAETPTLIERNFEQKRPLVKKNIKTSWRVAFSP